MKAIIFKTTFLFILLFSSSMVLAQKYETQDFLVKNKLSDKIEIRHYPSVMKAKISDEKGQNKNFSKLFKYISGNNSSKQKIAMTTPVYMDKNTMEFVLPKDFTQENTPKPTDQSLVTYSSESGDFAAITYGGYTNKKKENKLTKELLDTLAKNKIVPISKEPIVAVYNAPFKFYNRKNEILIPIKSEN